MATYTIELTTTANFDEVVTTIQLLYKVHPDSGMYIAIKKEREEVILSNIVEKTVKQAVDAAVDAVVHGKYK